MAGRGATSFQKRQKEMQRKERQQEKFAKRMERKKQSEPDLTADAGDGKDGGKTDDSGSPIGAS